MINEENKEKFQILVGILQDEVKQAFGVASEFVDRADHAVTEGLVAAKNAWEDSK